VVALKSIVFFSITSVRLRDKAAGEHFLWRGTLVILHRRKFLQVGASATALTLGSNLAQAQVYPTRTISIIVPFAPGGATDVVARIVGDHMSRTLGQQLIVENVPGAGGTVGSIRAMRAKPDGYTIEMGHMGTHAASVAFYPNLAYKPDIDFAPIGFVIEQSMVIVARKDFPAKNLEEFVSYLKANADRLNMAHAGVGSTTFNFCVMLNGILGVKPTLVPFNGSGPATNAIMAGQVDYMCNGIPETVSQIQAGAIKAYAIGGPQRSPVLPDVPTATEAGLPEFEARPWWALFAPKGTSPPILDRLTAALDKALDDENVRRRLAEIGCEVPDKSRRGQAALAALVKTETARWLPIIRAANVRVE
jgi:putative tricarboxylic transport membrane protein